MAEFTRQLRSMRAEKLSKKHEIQKKVIVQSERCNTVLSDHVDQIQSEVKCSV